MSKRKIPEEYSAHQAIDSHAHLDPAEFGDELPHIIASAFEHGVAGIISIAADKTPDSFPRIAQVAANYENIWLVAGVHPHYASEMKSLWPQVQALMDDGRLVGLGEFGLDYHYDWSPRRVQQDVMRRQVEASLTRGLPAALHIREAYEEALRILDEFGDQFTGVLHCFSAGSSQAREFLNRGFHISIPGIVTFAKAEELQQALGIIPLDRLLVETDTPYLAPAPFRGRRNEPSYVAFVVDRVAQLKGVSPEELAQTTASNTRSLFKLDEKDPS